MQKRRPAIGAAPNSLIAEIIRVARVHRHQNIQPIGCHAGDIRLGQAERQIPHHRREARSAIAGNIEPIAIPTRVRERTESANACIHHIRVASIKRQRPDRQRVDEIRGWRPRRIGTGGIGRAPNATVHRANQQDIRIGGMDGDDIDRAIIRTALSRHAFDLPIAIDRWAHFQPRLSQRDLSADHKPQN